MAKSKLPSPSVRDTDGVEFFSSGCTLLDAALGGGWAVGKVSNILGESASGKSLLGIEAAANFMMSYPNGHIVHIDTEAAFDPDYAETLGLNTEAIDLYEDFATVEQVASMFDSMLEERDDIPDQVVGRVVLTRVDDATSTGVVVDASSPIRVGDQVATTVQ